MTDAAKEIPPFVRADGTDNGAWFHSRHVFVQNEDTAALPDLVDRRSFHEILALGELPPRPLDPPAALRSLKPRDGFVVELVASEPLVMDPVAFAFGPDGKLWVAEMADYPLGVDGQGKPGGRVRFLEDRDGDGQYETSKLFLEDVPFPTGVMPWRKGVLVTAAPDVIYAEDLDGDGKADRRLTLFSGFGEGNQQHRVNGLVWGLDNWVHLANGDSGGKVKSLKTGQEVAISGRDVRIRPDDGAIDVTTGQAQFGRCSDDWGNWFGCNNSRPMYHYVLDDYYLRRNPHFAPPDPRIDVSVAPGAAPVFPASRTVERFNDFDRANRFTSACSVMICRDRLFGPAFAGNAFISEPVHNLVHREVMRADGVTFKSQRAPDEQRSEFLVSTDNWFRPTMIQTGPDGALWVADMYRHVIEHPQWIPDHWQKRLDLRAGHDRGRIYRVFPVGTKPRPIPRLDKLDTAELVEALDSDSGWQRDMAQQLLVQRADKSAVALLKRQAAESSRPLCRLHSLCTLDGLNALSAEALLRGLMDEHPGARRHAARLCERLKDRPSALLQRLASLADDPDPAVRMQVAYTLGALGDRSSGVVLGRMLALHGGDRFMVAAIMSSVHKGNIDGLLAEFLKDAGPGDATRRHLDSLLALAAGLQSDSALATLLEEITQPLEGRHAAWQFAALANLLDALGRQERPLARLQADGDARLKLALSRLPGLFAAARKLAAEASAAEADRTAAVAILGRGPDGVESDLELLSVLLAPQSAPAIQQAAVSALSHVRHERVPSILLARWKESSPALRPQLLDALLGREAWHEPLLAALEAREVESSALDAAGRQRLLESRVVHIRDRAKKLFALASSSDRHKVIAQYQSALNEKADLERGAALFQKTCSVCHKLGGIGHEVGPDLAALADKSPEALLVAVLDPNRAVETRYTAYTVLTKDGVTMTGLLSAETTASITLKAQEGKELTVLRGDIEQLASSGKSTMPEGIEKDLAPRDLADIIAYVRAKVPLPPRKTFAGNSPALVRPAADGSLLLDTSTCEIYGSTLVLEEKYKNLGYWSSLDDQAVWRIDVPKDAKYAVRLDWACHNGTAVNTALIEVAGRALSFKVIGTGTWDEYHQYEFGTLELPAGQHRLVMKADRRIQGALIDLRSIRLVPAK
jgi:putative membrane-bound dehydrogenase-like protein